MGAVMIRFDQGSVRLSYLEVGRAGKGQPVKTRMNRASVRPPNLPYLPPARTHTHTRTRVRTPARIYARMHPHIRLGEVRRLDRTSIGAGFCRPTFRPTVQPMGMA